ncbi:MAG TPA: cytochrome c biogenesis protein CcdA [Candidatus Paceibacterota bacterium]|nr:cytochrome c biogenesis protein CcdA [Candidatus Paceibacterota bacterium]
MTLLVIAFVAGLLTVLAPCTLPLLPVIIGGSISGKSNSWRALVISASLGASVFLFTLLLKVSTLFINVPQSFWQIVSGGLLIIFGLVTLFPGMWERFGFAHTLNLQGNRLLAQGYTRQNIVGDIIMGAALGPVFSSCSPTYFIVLATVLPVHPAEGALYLLAYCAGLILSLLLVSVIGQRIVLWLGIASNPRGWFKRTIGALFLLIGIIIAAGYSTSLESTILSHAGIFDVTQIEQHLLGVQNLSKASQYKLAPELAGIDGYINTGGQPITLASLRGKVVLIDFWTYSCINCLRTIPYQNAWYAKYKDQGLVIIGVETPEFAFEHVQSNVEAAVKSLGIQYPVVQDNEYATWNAFNNEYWPNDYLVDIDGYIVDQHSGEGDYAQTEAAIQQALAERAARMGTTTMSIATSTVNIPEANLSAIQSPETYFGSSRNEFLGNGTQGQSGVQAFTIPDTLNPNTLYLGGSWDVEPEYAANQAPASIVYEYSAHDINLVASGGMAGVTLDILLDGKPVGNLAGTDTSATTSTAYIKEDRLYNLVHDATPGVHTIEIRVENAGLEAYTFTFG